MATQQKQQDQQPILVVGAGELGTAVLEALTTHPQRDAARHPVSVMLRSSTITSTDAAKQASNERLLRDLGAAELVPGDVAHDPEDALAKTFKRFHAVVVCAGMGLAPGTQTRIARAALAARVPRFLPWQWGVDYDAVGAGSAQDLFDEQLAVRGLLRDPEANPATTDWTIVSVGLFASFLFYAPFGVVDLPRRVVRALGAWDNKLTITTPRDIGRVAAEIVYVPGEPGTADDTRRRVVYAAGDTVTYARIAELVEQRFGGGGGGGKEEGGFSRELWTADTLRRRLEENPDDGMAKYLSVWVAGRGVAWDPEATINRRRGLRMTGLEEYLAQMPDLS